MDFHSDSVHVYAAEDDEEQEEDEEEDATTKKAAVVSPVRDDYCCSGNGKGKELRPFSAEAKNWTGAKPRS